MRHVPRRLPLRSFSILAALLTLGACAGSPAGTTPSDTPPGVVEVRVTPEGVGAFRPGRVEVPRSATVRWYNDTPAPHNVVFSALPAASSKLFKAGAAHTAVFDTPGEWAYVCTLHPTMRGVVAVRP